LACATPNKPPEKNRAINGLDTGQAEAMYWKDWFWTLEE